MSKASPDFNLADGRGYMLGRSYAAASRLNFQHYLWRESLHFNLHPSISIPEKARIADVATGTAIWLVDIAREYPTAQLDGFDINTSQAPPKQWLPPNITLKTWNIFDDVPQHMIGIYDVVHVRLLVLVVQKGDPRKILRNLICMLKPGGYIQWDELNYPGTHVKNSSNSSLTPALDELREMVYSRGRNDWILQLPDFFIQEGLLDTEIYHFQDLPEFARANGEQHLLTMEEFASSLAEVGHREEAAKIFRLIRDVGQEVLDGAALSMPRVVCVGRKASEQIRGKWLYLLQVSSLSIQVPTHLFIS